MNKIIALLLFLIIVMVSSMSACARQPANPNLILATTTSTYDTGLLDELVPAFEAESGYIVKIISVGTGKALTMGEEGNADVLLVHAPSAEEEFMANGFGSERYLVMHNDFVITGPSDDPIGIRGMDSPVEVLAKIAQSQATFASRGDDSGTHKKELAYWSKAGITPQGDWYLESGQGMGATLQIASEKKAYTLTDRATYLSLMDVLSLEILVEGDSSLLNIYHVMIVNPERWPKINLQGAQALAAYLISPAGQAIIETFGVDEYGQPLFFPDAHKTDADFGQEP